MPTTAQHTSTLSLLKNQLDHLQRLLLIYYKVKNEEKSDKDLHSIVSNQYLDITYGKSTIFEQYDAVLKWCFNHEKDIHLEKVKRSFIEVHEKDLREQLQKRNNFQHTLVKELHKSFHNLKEKCEQDTKKINDYIESQKNCLVKLKKAGGFIAKNTINQKQDVKITIAQLKELILQLKERSLSIPETKTLPLKTMPVIPNIKLQKREQALTQLDLSIFSYKTQLQQESLLKRFFNLFSIPRYRRRKALGEYEKYSTNINDADSRYEVIVLWANRHADSFKSKTTSTSRFYNNCLYPFAMIHEQLAFEEIPALHEPQQLEINRVVNITREATVTHNAEMTSKNQLLEKLENEISKLKQNIDTFISEVERIKYQGQGCSKDQLNIIREKMNTLSPCLETQKDPAIKEAESLSEDLANITRHTPDDKVQQLGKRFTKTIKKNKNATAIIEKAIDDLIEEVIQQGGKGNSFKFMGNLKAEQIVVLLGNSKQQLRFKNIKSDIVQKARQINLEAEGHFVNHLKRDLKEGKLPENLLRWHDAYLKHKGLKKKTDYDDAETIYTKEIKAVKQVAAQFHQKNFKPENVNVENKKMHPLSQCVDEVIIATLNASIFNPRTAQNLLESLGWKRADMFVTIYGNDNQIKEWRTGILPQIKKNLGVEPAQKIETQRASTSPTKKV